MGKIKQLGRKKKKREMVGMPKVDTVLLFAKIQDTPWASHGDKDITITLWITVS